MQSCQINFRKSYTEKKPQSICLLVIQYLQVVHLTQQKLDCYKGEDCMESFCKDLREHTMKIMNCKTKEMIPLTEEENDLYEMQKVCYIGIKTFSTDKNNKNVFKLHHKV